MQHWLPRFVVVTRHEDEVRVRWVDELRVECDDGEEEEEGGGDGGQAGVVWSGDAAARESLDDWGFQPESYVYEPRGDALLPDWASAASHSSPLVGVRGVSEDYAPRGVAADPAGFYGQLPETSLPPGFVLTPQAVTPPPPPLPLPFGGLPAALFPDYQPGPPLPPPPPPMWAMSPAGGGGYGHPWPGAWGQASPAPAPAFGTWPPMPPMPPPLPLSPWGDVHPAVHAAQW